MSIREIREPSKQIEKEFMRKEIFRNSITSILPFSHSLKIIQFSLKKNLFFFELEKKIKSIKRKFVFEISASHSILPSPTIDRV
jgi:predicted nuclease of restriction endonuclease-like (RecB) superfamily